MRTIAGFIAFLLFISLPGLSCAADPAKSTADEQIGMEVTVYNNNLGLIKDTRNVKLSKGEGELQFMDVAAKIMPVTVHVKSTNDPNRFLVLEQNYEYDLMSPAKLLDKYVGKKMKIVNWNQFQDRKDTVDATLLSNNQGAVYRIGDEIYLNYPGQVILPSLPENLIAKPTLTWQYHNECPSPHTLEVSYLTQSLTWKADYVVVLGKDDTTADVSGWVTLDNQSGAAYKDAKLKLVAGEVNRVQEADQVRRAVPAAAMELGKAKAAQFQEKSFFEYHIYDLQRKTTLKDKQTKQISLLEAFGVKVKKELLVHGVKTWFTVQFQEKVPKQPVSVFVQFKNSKDNNLGMPLPAGTMRLYKKDDAGSGQFIGEDAIQHTPKDEQVKLKIGEAFDVVAERVQTDFKRLTTRMIETEWEVKVRNHKDEDITVGLIEPLFDNWEVISKTHAYTKLDAFTIRFDVKVPKDGETVVKYRVRVGI